MGAAEMMRAALVLLCLVAGVCWGDGQLNGPLEVGMGQRVLVLQAQPVAATVVIKGGGETVVLAMVSRAPFPQLPSVPPSRLAVLRFLATCQHDAFQHCDVAPEAPICPMRLARCLASVPPKDGKSPLSQSCQAGLEELRSMANKHISHEQLLQKDATVRQEQQLLGKLDCPFWHVLLGILIVGAMFCVCTMCAQEDDEAPATSEVVFSEPYQCGTVVLTAPVVSTV